MEEMYNQGLSYKKIAEKLDVSLYLVWENLKNFAQKTPRDCLNKKKFSEEDIKKMKQMYIQGLSYQKIAKNFNCSYNAIIRHLKYFIKENPRDCLNKKNFSEEDMQKMKEMRSKGLSYRKIAEEFNCSDMTIIKYMKLQTKMLE